jgi:histone H3/H4
MAEMLVVKSKMAEFIKGKGMMMASDSPEAVSNILEKMLEKGIERCKANGRKTVKPYDF